MTLELVAILLLAVWGLSLPVIPWLLVREVKRACLEEGEPEINVEWLG